MLEQARIEWEQKQTALTTVQAARVPLDQLQQREKEQVESTKLLTQHLFAIAQTEQQLKQCQLLKDYHAYRQVDPGKAAAAWQNIVEGWTVAGQIAPLKALTPEQLTLAALQGTGMLTRHRKEALAQATAIRAKAEAKAKAAEKKAESAKESGDGKAAAQPNATADSEAVDVGSSISALEQQKLIDGLRSRLDQFATLYGGLPGEDFQATVNQALFFGNGNVVDEWLKAGQGNLTDELAALEVAVVPERMFLSILTRLPSESERNDLLQSLTADQSDRQQVLARWEWALLSSSEFRFNH